MGRMLVEHLHVAEPTRNPHNVDRTRTHRLMSDADVPRFGNSSPDPLTHQRRVRNVEAPVGGSPLEARV